MEWEVERQGYWTSCGKNYRLIKSSQKRLTESMDCKGQEYKEKCARRVCLSSRIPRWVERGKKQARVDEMDPDEAVVRRCQCVCAGTGDLFTLPKAVLNDTCASCGSLSNRKDEDGGR